MRPKLKLLLLLLLLLNVCYFSYNGVMIDNFSKKYSEEKSDVAIVLGASIKGGKLSPVFRERINHGIYLYNQKIVNRLLLTGGFGKNQTIAESAVAKKYALSHGIPESAILTEEVSKYTFQNIIESKKIMDSLHIKSALLVSDPIHMKRAMDMAHKYNLNCKSSPTKTTMFRSFGPKMGFLIYESFYYSIGRLAGYN